MLDRYPQEVKVVFKNYPLAKHKFARNAASAALAADAQGKFWDFHHRLFENFRVINDAKIKDIAKELGLDIKKFNVDMFSSAIGDLIRRDVNNGRQIGVRGIPTIFVNGKLQKKHNVLGFQQRIDSELKKER